MLSSAERVTVRKLDHTGRQVTAYSGWVVRRSKDDIVLRTAWERPPMDLGFVVLEPGDRWTEYFYADRWYNIFEICTSDGRLKGWYCDVARPASISAHEVAAEDLALDLWVAPDGETKVLDEAEFAALPLASAERQIAQEAVSELEAMVAGRKPPFDGVDDGYVARSVERKEGVMEEVMGEVAEVAGERLREQGLTLATAESCTGGLVSHLITNVPGSSDYYRGSVVAYANEVKEALLGVGREAIKEHGAVSPQVALEMAQGVRRALQADVGLAVTGIAGPGGGTPEKPVGLVYIALAAPEGEWVERHMWEWGRRLNKALSAEAALDLLRRYLEEQG
ncbi:MAG: nicotinamide-nucleotide amidohydrolase family protein [Anaerolineae bacterium]